MQHMYVAHTHTHTHLQEVFSALLVECVHLYTIDVRYFFFSTLVFYVLLY